MKPSTKSTSKGKRPAIKKKELVYWVSVFNMAPESVYAKMTVKELLKEYDRIAGGE